MTTLNVLIPLDGSQLSRAIIPHVRRMLANERGHITLLRVAEPPVSITGAPPRPMALGWTRPMYADARDIEYARHPIYSSQIEQNARAEIERELLDDRHALEQAGFDVSISIRFGNPADEIADVARREHVDLIAMATHGSTGLRRLVLGSVTEQVLSQVSVPVLLLRPFHEGAGRPGEPVN